jgi:digalactosyldiacylglycerol synthase
VYTSWEKHNTQLPNWKCFLAYNDLWITAATQYLPRSSICNVHGVNPQFLSIGKRLAEADDIEPKFSKGAYYLGKMIWGKDIGN